MDVAISITVMDLAGSVADNEGGEQRAQDQWQEYKDHRLRLLDPVQHGLKHPMHAVLESKDHRPNNNANND